MKTSMICKGCWSQLHVPVVIRGPLAIPFRALGLGISRMHPNLCTLCETQFAKAKKAKQITVRVSVLFADVRGYTTLSEVLENPAIARLLSSFYERCASVIWERDGLINKLIGDAMLALFNFPLVREDHVRQAVQSGVELQRACAGIKASLGLSGQELAIGVGVGIHTGDVLLGEVGEFCRDFTAVGSVVNLASRLQGAAEAGEVLVTEEVYREVADLFPAAEARSYHLKGVEHPVSAYSLRA
ncbi:MAG: adenylate/guanylate cyclase domain-containing protein [Chloroflexi bacterium]|nr:adenylate/guanylate cyclase domain-containing protein [Chloroflexota bacterium]MBI4505741.1 adenylate/guanylate cyclase domain-containing protein [Chloroflexota bacterium]